MAKKSSRSKTMTLADHHAHLKATGRYDAMIARKEARRKRVQALSQALYAEEAPLVAELRAAGFDVDSAWGLFNRKEPWRTDLPVPKYTSVIPILIDHFQRDYYYGIKQGIVRALTDREARHAYRSIHHELKRTATEDVARSEIDRALEVAWAGTPGLYEHDELRSIMAHRYKSYRFALANAAFYHFTKPIAEEMVELLQDQVREPNAWETLTKSIRSRINRWRTPHAALLGVLDKLDEANSKQDAPAYFPKP